MKVYFGVVENRSDPLQLGRCQVRVVGLHTHDKSLLPTSDLPWCASLQPTTSAAMNGIGHSPLGPVEGTSVVVTYLDDSMQQGLVLGGVGGIATEPLPIDFDDSGPIIASNKIELVELRTIPGPVNGNKLTFYDPSSDRTDLTSVLKANMKVVGYQLPENTTIVSIDSGTQITISNTVREYTENIIKFENPPSNLNAIAESRSTVIGSTTATQADDVKQTSTNQTIPTIPPAKSVTNVAQASEGIKALISACDKVGLTTKEQKCALLGIAGGESGWIPKLEAYNYNPARLKQVYSFATEEDVEKYSNAQKKGLTRQEFFSWAYGPTKRGKNFLGNKTDDDGGKYHGRGFIQLTGRSNYTKYQKLAANLGLSVNIVEDPDSLDADINVSAIVAALFIKNEVPKGVNPNAHPGFFFAAKQAVGVNTPDIAARKQSYYEYFYGLESSGGVVKDAGAVSPGEPVITGTDRPGPSDKSIQSGSYGVGFRDPNNKYPLKDYLGESDINRLARGVVEGTVVGLKDAKRIYGIPKAVGMGSWDQPQPVFGAKYPFNKVFESESGHIQEFDDTPGQERVHTYHRAGTFTEIDANGTQVNYIVGDNYILMEKNGCIHVAGECNITVDGNTNIYARSDANIEVAQNASVRVGNNLDIGVATDVTMAVGGDMNVKVAGTYSIDANAINIKAQEALNVQAVAELSVKGNSTSIESVGEFNILAGGTMNMDYVEGQFGNGAAGANDVENVELTPPPQGEPLNSNIPYSIPPERQIEENATIETPDDWDTPEGRAVSADVNRKEAIAGAAVVIADESAPVATGGRKDTISVDKSLIMTTKDYTNDYRLSKNFSLGMLIADGVNGRHRLTAQMLRYGGSQDRLFTVEEIVGNLAETAHNVLEPALEVLPGGIGGWKTQWEITSGYRLKGVIPSESATSDHCKGHCVDIILKHPDLFTKSYEMIQQIERVVSYDQIILEYRYPGKCWMHIGYRPSNNRKWAFTMVNDATYKRNTYGIPAGFYLLSTIPAPAKK
jgi:predicted chitinase